MRGRKSFGRRSFKNLSGTLERVFVEVQSVSKNMASPWRSTPVIRKVEK